MDKDRLKALLPGVALKIAEVCAFGAALTAGISAVPGASSATTTGSLPPDTFSIIQIRSITENVSEGAIYLKLVETNPATGQQVAQHYSHASHSSHSSHYSSR